MQERDLDMDARRLVALERNARERDAVRRSATERVHDLRDRLGTKNLELSRIQANPVTERREPQRITDLKAEIDEISRLIRIAEDEAGAASAICSSAQTSFKRAREFAVQMGLELPAEIRTERDFA